MPFPTATDAERAFYNAFVKRDISAMRTVWVAGAEAACIHPGGPLLLGIEDIIASWGDIFSGASAPNLQVRTVQTRVDADTALHIVEERIETPAERRSATVIATNVYQRSADGWSMRLHHASLPLVEPTDKTAPTQPALH